MPVTGITTIIENQNEIVKVAAESNCGYQCKIEGTAFRTDPLLLEFGYCTNNKENVDAILNGMYVIPPRIDKYAEEFIEAIEMPNSIYCKDTITLSVSPEEQKSVWKKQNASTTCKSIALHMNITNPLYLMTPSIYMTA